MLTAYLLALSEIGKANSNMGTAEKEKKKKDKQKNWQVGIFKEDIS